MSIKTAHAVADSIADLEGSIEIIWHGGEPLSSGINHFSALLDPFETSRKQGKVTHAIQTNATLINEAWCVLFREKEFRVGVSIDGPVWADYRRTDWRGKEAHKKILHGIEQLCFHNIPFSAICVLGSEGFNRIEEVHDFFMEIGCSSLGINIEETLGVHVAKSSPYTSDVAAFWETVFLVWREKPTMQIQDLKRALDSLSKLSSHEEKEILPERYDIFPSVAWNGDVVLLAPEFLNTKSQKYRDFVVGNINQHSLSEIIKTGKRATYVQDFVAGVAKCQETCNYFSVCFGGQAGNKFFEHGTTDATETTFCRNSEQSLVQGILNGLNLSR